jgi:hypothetical protein
MPHKLISSQLDIGATLGNFVWLVYSKASARSSLFNFDTGLTYYWPIGQKVANGTSPNQIPVSADASLDPTLRNASEVELYAIVD